MRKLISALPRLTSLKSLSLRGIHLDTVPDEIRSLQQLNHLSVDALLLHELPEWLGEFHLESLSAIDNKLTSLPESFRSFRRLHSLTLSWNPLANIPNVTFQIASLTKLELHDCDLTEIPEQILKLRQLSDLECTNNPIATPPIEVARNGVNAIRDYWRQRTDAGVDYLCEAKLIILGESGAGKTSLAQKIKDPDYVLVSTEKSTEGIDVIRYAFPTSVRTQEQATLHRSFQVGIWDFGGQEIYHSTHQFFLTRRSVYVLVCDDRKEDTDFEYWLQIVEMLSDASPLLIVQNEKQDRSRDINLSSLRARFPNLRDALATNLETNRGLDRVVQSIQKQLELLPHVGSALPATWKRVREALEADNRDYITIKQYYSICQKSGFRLRKDKLQLSGYLHDLGVCLHFQDDATLKSTVILKPSWGTDAVYRVLDDSDVIAARGQFTRRELDRIWSEKKYEGMQDELLRLMMKFQLCYALDGSGTYIAPQLLQSERPTYAWETGGGLVVRYVYEFLPKGIVTRFIVAIHRLIRERLVWKTGVVLERDGSLAEVVEDYSKREIKVRVIGPSSLGLLAIVDDQLSQIHASFPRLKCDRLLPCPCVECVKRLDPYSFALEHLTAMARKGTTIQCHASGKMVDAVELVSRVLPGALRPESFEGERSHATALAHVSSTMDTSEVFVSYAWSEESCAIVDRLQQVFTENGIRLLRDREEVRYKDSIREFMRRIGRGKCVVVIISEKYLTSENCMFELVELVKAEQVRERIFPIVLKDANIYKATGRIKYVRYWESEMQELDAALKTVRGDSLRVLQDDLNSLADIRRLFDGIAGTLRDLNALSVEQHSKSEFEELIQRVRGQLDGRREIC